jgi:broad specificity phosphatase PhoE
LIHFARHGHVHNPENLLYGNLPGFHLSGLGREQAFTLGRRVASLRLAAVYASPLERAVETAAIATARPVVTVPALRDWEPDPSWVGVPWADIPGRDEKRWAEFRERPWIDAASAARAVLAIAARHHGEDVLVVGHQDPLRAVLQYLCPIPGRRLRDDPWPQCGLRTVDPRSWWVVGWWDPPGATGWPTALPSLPAAPDYLGRSPAGRRHNR